MMTSKHRTVRFEQARTPVEASMPSFLRATTAHRQHFGRCASSHDDDQAVARNDAKQVMELALDRRDTGKMSDVVEFELLRMRSMGVVDDFERLSKTRCRIQRPRDKRRTGSEPCRNRKLQGTIANQESRSAGRLQQQAISEGGRGLAMRAGHGRLRGVGPATARPPCGRRCMRDADQAHVDGGIAT